MKNIEIMRYRNDNQSSLLCILAVVLNAIYFIIFYKSTAIPDAMMGIDILYNIVFMLIAFLASQKVKIYLRGWSIVTLTLAVLQVIRIFVFPMPFALREEITSGKFVVLMLFLLATAAALVFASLLCWIKSTALRSYLAEVEEKEEASE